MQDFFFPVKIVFKNEGEIKISKQDLSPPDLHLRNKSFRQNQNDLR